MATMQAPRAFLGHQHHSLVLALKGEVRYMAVRTLRAFMDDFVAQCTDETMIIDLRELEAIDSTGMGLLARLGRTTLEHGRRAVLVCATEDVMLCLRSAAFDKLFIIEENWPFDEEAPLREVPLEASDLEPDVMGRFILEAHRDLASLSDANQQTFGGVVSALAADLKRRACTSKDD
jgi:anti-anti-sigma factor